MAKRLTYEELDRKVKKLEKENVRRKRSEEVLRESEESLSITLNSIGDAVIATDTEGQVVRMNPVAEKLTGWYFSEAKGRPLNEVFKIINEETRNTIESPVERVLREGVVGLANHTVLIAKDGTEFPIDESGAPIRNDKGDITGVVLIFRDATEKRQAEEALRAAQKELETIVDSVPAFIVYKDINNRYIRINKIFADSMNLPKDHIEGKSAFDITQNRELAEKYWRDDKEIIASGIPKRNIIEPPITDETRWVQTDKIPYLDAKGDIVGVIGFGIDITSQVQAERVLEENEEKYRQLFELSSDSLFLFERKTGQILDLNEAGINMYGYSREEALQIKTTDFSGEPDKTRHTIAEAERFIPVRYHRKKDGTVFPTEILICYFTWREKEVCLASIRDITNRIKAEEALKESEGRYRRIVETAQEGIWMIDAEGNTIYVNRQLAEMFGYTVEEMLGRFALDFVDDSNRQEAERRIERRKRGMKDQYDFEFKRKDGSVLWATVSANPMFDDDGQFIGNFSMISDISDRRRTEEALKGSEERHRALVESSSDAILMMDKERKIVSCNQAFLDLFGYDENEVDGRSIRIIHQSDESFRSFGEVAYPAIERDGTFRGEWDFVRKDGNIFPVESVTSVMKSHDGAKTGYVAIIRDISERRQAEEALRESEEKYRITLQSIPDSVCINRQKDGLFYYANEGFSRTMGYSVEETEGKTPLDLNIFVNPDDRDEFIKILKEKGELHRFELQYRKKDGTIFDALISARPLRYGEEDCLVSLVKDITPIKEAERDKSKLQVQFQHAQRMESIGTLAGGLAHNFNNLLMGIMGNTSIMLLDIDSSHPFHKNLKNIEKMIKSGSQVTKQLLGYAREGRFEVKPISLNQLLKETSDTFGTTRKEIRVHQELAENLLGINADEGQIEQVLMNLFVNAADAMPEGGDLFLKTINVTHEDMAGKEYEPKPENYVLLTVRDTGIGIDKKIMARIFDPFFTTKGLAEGTGLGLASSYGIIKAHGGYIDVDSEEGKGTTFEIYLPATEEEAKAETEMSGEIVKGKETILLVDDEEIVLDTGELMLKKLGYEVLSAMSGSDALELYKKNQDRIDMILLDMVMPGMGGSKTFDRLKEINPKIKVLLSSGYSIDGQAKGILKRGCNGFIQKPFSLEQLSQNIRKILDKE